LDVDLERGLYLSIRVVRSRILHLRDLISELGGVATVASSCLQTGVCDEPSDDELVNAPRPRRRRGLAEAYADCTSACAMSQPTSHQYSFIDTCIRRAEFDCVCHLPKLLF
jgi:hypothetical protein